jgi:hypothetical protein
MRPLSLILIALLFLAPTPSRAQGIDSTSTRDRIGSLVAYVDGRKDGGVATVAWLVFPGAGLMYADKTGQGLLFLAADIALAAACVDANSKGRGLIVGGAVASRLLEILLTLNAVHDYNHKLKGQLGLASLHGATELKFMISYPL